MRKQMAVTILIFLLAASQICCAFSAFADVTYNNASSWAVPELDRAAGYGLITDKVKNDMKALITREEFSEIAVKLYEKCTGNKASYSDMSVFVDTENPEIFKAYSLKIVNGTDTNRKLFSPYQITNREQIAAMMYRTVQAIMPDTDFSADEIEGFSDINNISDWALESVEFMTENGFIKGGDGRISPKGICTREMALLIATRVYEAYSEGNTGNVQNGSEVYNWSQIVINDTEIFRDNYHLMEKNDFYYIFIEAQRLKYALKYPGIGSYTYPEVDIIGDDISISWNNGEKSVLKVGLKVGNAEALVNGKKVDAGMAPYNEDGEIFVPINLFVSAMDMDVETSSDGNILYIQYKNTFPADVLEGAWSDTYADLFSEFEGIKAGKAPKESYATAYSFNSDGTYELRMISAGGYNDTFIMQKGRYKIMGNTIMYYDIIETVYKGNPPSLRYEERLLDIPYYEFIHNYDSKEDRIEIGGFWYNRY